MPCPWIILCVGWKVTLKLCIKTRTAIGANIDHTCLTCGRECISLGVLKKYMKVYGDQFLTASFAANATHAYKTYSKWCKSLAGLKSHIWLQHH